MLDYQALASGGHNFIHLASDVLGCFTSILVNVLNASLYFSDTLSEVALSE